MKINATVFLAGALALACPAVAVAADCDAYRESARRAERDLREFGKFVLDPLRERRDALEEELRREVEGPERLARKIASLHDQGREAERKKRSLEETLPGREDKAASLASRLDDLSRRIDDAVAAGEKKEAKKLQKERKEVAGSYRSLRRKISRARTELEELAEEALEREERIGNLTSRREKILADPPTAAELESRLAEVRRDLQDEKGLKNRKEGEAALFRSALALCRDERELRLHHDSYRETVRRIRLDGCPSYLRGGEGEAQALRDMNCR